MYDCGVCLYIVVALFAFSWSIVGIVWSGSCPSGSIKTAALASKCVRLCVIVTGYVPRGLRGSLTQMMCVVFVVVVCACVCVCVTVPVVGIIMLCFISLGVIVIIFTLMQE